MSQQQRATPWATPTPAQWQAMPLAKKQFVYAQWKKLPAALQAQASPSWAPMVRQLVVQQALSAPFWRSRPDTAWATIQQQQALQAQQLAESQAAAAAAFKLQQLQVLSLSLDPQQVLALA